MMERGAIWLVVLVASCLAGEWMANDEQFQITPFEKVIDGVLADWKSTDEANVQGSTEKFGAAMAWDDFEKTGKIWLVSRRYIPVASGPVQLVKPGGIVSTLQLPTNSWTHQPHTLDMNGFEIKVFSLGGHLLMLTYTNSDNVIKYLKLFAWNEKEWSEIPFDTSGVENPSGSRPRLSVTVPDQSSNIAYLAASANGSVTTSEASVSKLDVTLDVNSKQPIKAKLLFLRRTTSPSPAATVACTPVIEDENQLFVFWSENSSIKPGEILAMDKNETQGFAINTDWERELETEILMDVNKDNCIQRGSDSYETIFFGQRRSANGNLVPHVWSYHLQQKQLQDAVVSWKNVSDLISNPKVLLDQAKGKRNGGIYAIDLERGVYVARISYRYESPLLPSLGARMTTTMATTTTTTTKKTTTKRKPRTTTPWSEDEDFAPGFIASMNRPPPGFYEG